MTFHLDPKDPSIFLAGAGRGYGMGLSQDNICESCGWVARLVSRDFDFGRSGEVTTPVVCPKHVIVQADTGLNARDEGRGTEKHWRHPTSATDSAANQ